MNQEDGGLPHVTVGDKPDPDERVNSVWVLVAIDPNGGEGVYGQQIGGLLQNFVVSRPDMKDALEDYIRGRGSVEVCRREGIELEWREMKQDGEVVRIT
jgi:hypothetical protein